MLIVRDSKNNLKSLNIAPNHYVKVFDGQKNLTRVIGHVEDSLPGFEAFRVYPEKPEPSDSAKIYFVKLNGELLELK